MVFIDQMGKKAEVKNFPPEKIISLVPSITELLVELGLEKNLLGITKFCIHPERVFKSKEKIGGTKNLNIEKIKALNPDIIIGNKEENVKEQIEELAQHFPVWMSDVNTYDDALNMISSVGEITNTSAKALSLIQEIQDNFNKLFSANYLLKNKKVLYLIWYKPFMAVGKNTYIDSILHKIHCENVCENKERYFEISMDEIKQLKPDYILLSSEPFPFKEKHKQEIEKEISGQSKVILADGEMFSWYGYRMKFLPDYVMNMKE